MFVNSIIIFLLTKFHLVMKLNDTIINMRDNGLYYDYSRYVYKGSNPHNYIIFNDELWRIVYFNDDAIKIMRNNSIGRYSFDNNNSNVWDKSSLYKFLNTEYYDALLDHDLILNYPFSTNPYTGANVDHFLKNEKTSYLWSKVGLIGLGDYLLANSNTRCNNITSSVEDDNCIYTNYINGILGKDEAWSMTKDDASDDLVISLGDYYFGDSKATYELSVYPALYLKKNITLEGDGTISNPFKIK